MNRLIVMLGVVLLTGCAGPTKSGKVARVNAHNRMDIVNAIEQGDVISEIIVK